MTATPGQADAEARAEDDLEAMAVDAEDVDGALAAELRELADWYESSARHSKGIRANEQQLCTNRIRAALARAASGNAIAAQEPHAAPELLATEALVRFADDGQWLTCTDDGRLDLRAELLAVKAAVRKAFDAAARPAQPAPELAALRAQLADVLAWFASNGGGHYARVSGTILAREYKRAKLPLPDSLKHLAGQ